MSNSEGFVTVTMTAEVLSELVQYLKYHEDDIAYNINDFGELRCLFLAIFNRAPEKNPDD